jgi:hypothetical protein
MVPLNERTRPHACCQYWAFTARGPCPVCLQLPDRPHALALALQSLLQLPDRPHALALALQSLLSLPDRPHALALALQSLLSLTPPLVLRALFEDLRPDTSAPLEPLVGAPAGTAARLARAADAALGIKAVVQVAGWRLGAFAEPGRLRLPLRCPGPGPGPQLGGMPSCWLAQCSPARAPPPQVDRPLWDARAALLLLLMGRCLADADAMRLIGGAAFFVALLRDEDVRVRHYSSVFVLRQLMVRRPGQYRCASPRRAAAHLGVCVCSTHPGGLANRLCSSLAQLTGIWD